MADLVDYLRDKLEHADDVDPYACTCSRVFVGWDNPPATVRGRRNPECPIHGDEAMLEFAARAEEQ